jgi:opacity protein-like surface antigen
MRTTVGIVSFITAVLITTMVTSHAQSPSTGYYPRRTTGFYVKGGLGPTLLQDTDLTFPGVSGKRDVEFDVGVRFDIGGGYQVTDWFAVEFETGIAYNSIDSIDGATDADAWVINVPFMANVVFQCPRMGRFVPYIGVGAGFSSTVLDVDEIVIDNNVVFGGDESDEVFAYQAFAGFRYYVDPRWSIGAEYKYLGSDDPSWEVGGTSENIRMDNLHTHSLIVRFTYSF